MAKIQVKPAQETVEKVKKVVAKKVKEVGGVVVKKVKDKALEEGANIVNKVKDKAVEAGKKLVDKEVEKLHAHAAKHLSNWHAKAGENGPELAKMLQKHLRALLK